MRQLGLASRLSPLRFSEIMSFAVLGLQCVAYIAVLWLWPPSSIVRFAALLIAGFHSYCVQRYIASGFLRKAPKTATRHGNVLDPVGRLAIVTGANTGIGFETALELAKRRCCVVLACRSRERGETAVRRIKAKVPGASIVFAPLDLERQASVRDFVKRLPAFVTELTGATGDVFAVDMLINNAGFYSDERRVTTDGVEIVLGVNHVSAFLLTELLLPHLKRSELPARVVNLGSVAQTNVTPLRAADRPLSVQRALERSSACDHRYYGLSKLCNVMHAQYLADTHGLCAVSVNPGGVLTEVFRNVPFVERLLFTFGRSVLKSPVEGAQTTLHCLLAPSCSKGAAATVPNGSSLVIPGGFYADCRLRDDCRNRASVRAEEINGMVEWSRLQIQD